MTDRELMQQALAALEAAPMSYRAPDTIEALRARLAQPEARPVAHQFQTSDGNWHGFLNSKHHADTAADGRWPIRALYATPQAQPAPDAKCDGGTCGLGGYCADCPKQQPAPVPLTDEQVWANMEIMGVNAFAGMRMNTLMEMVRAIERAHGIAAPGATK